MTFAIAAVIEAYVCVHRCYKFMVVHRILSVSESQFSKLLANGSFAEVKHLPALSLTIPIL